MIRIHTRSILLVVVSEGCQYSMSAKVNNNNSNEIFWNKQTK